MSRPVVAWFTKPFHNDVKGDRLRSGPLMNPAGLPA